MQITQGSGQATGSVQSASRHSYRFFRNHSCEFFPCHKASGEESFNCLFCYCPLYSGDCPGEAEFRTINGRSVKDCSGCEFPHQAENYDDMIRCLIERIS